MNRATYCLAIARSPSLGGDVFIECMGGGGCDYLWTGGNRRVVCQFVFLVSAHSLHKSDIHAWSVKPRCLVLQTE